MLEGGYFPYDDAGTLTLRLLYAAVDLDEVDCYLDAVTAFYNEDGFYFSSDAGLCCDVAVETAISSANAKQMNTAMATLII